MNNQTHKRSVRQHRWHAGIVPMLLCIVFIAAPRPALSFKIQVPALPQPFLGWSIHENITREGLGFLRREAYETAVTGNWDLDYETGPLIDIDYPWFHFDDASFKATMELQINPTYDLMLNKYLGWFNLVGDSPPNAAQAYLGLYAPDGGGGLDSVDYKNHLRNSVLYSFGRLLHSSQDLYSHSNWVELREQGFVTKRLIDTDLDYWRVPESHWEIYPGDTDIVLAQGNATTLPDGWTVSFLEGTHSPSPAGKTMKIEIETEIDNEKVIETKYGLLTGRFHGPDFYEWTHADFHWFHDDDVFGDYTGLNKDTHLRVYGFNEAAELAVLQTAHEWDRFVALVESEFGPEAVKTLESFSIDYQEFIWVDPSFRNEDNHHSRSNQLTPRDAFIVPGGSLQNPYRYVSIATRAANPAGATIFLDDDTHVGVQRIGKAGQPMRIQRRLQDEEPEQPGTARLVN